MPVKHDSRYSFGALALRFLCIGWTAEHPHADAAVDVAAAAFRMIDHTEFERYAASILIRLNCNNWEHLRQLRCL